MTGEQLGFFMEAVMEAGALDAFFTNIMMKKSRPAVMLTVLCKAEDKERLSEFVLKNTSTFGIRYIEMERDILERNFIEVNTDIGSVKCKQGILQGKVIKCFPEYEECKRIAKETGVSILDIYKMAASETVK